MRSARIVQTNNRSADFHRQIHDLADLFRMRFGKRSSKHGEVLREHKHVTTVDQTVTRDHTVARVDLLVESEVFRAMHDKLVKLFKGTFIKQKLNRSRAVIFPAPCCFSTRAAPPPCSACALRSRRASRRDFDCLRCCFEAICMNVERKRSDSID